MALTRKLLKGMGLTEEQVDTIIEAHTDTVDGMKADLSKYKSDAEQLQTIQKELDALKAKGDDGYHEKYTKLKADFEAYKNDVTKKETKATKEKAARAYFEGKNITGKNLELAMRGSGAEISALEMDGDKIKDTTALDSLVNGVYSGLVTTTVTTGARTANPPANNGNGKMSRADIVKIKDPEERRAAIAANIDVFDKKGNDE